MSSPSRPPPHSLPPQNRAFLQRLTLQRHLLDQLSHTPRTDSDFGGLLHQIALASKIIASKVRGAGLADILGMTGEVNVQGEEVQKLDVFANNTIVHCVEAGGHVCIMGSEEVEEPIAVPSKYAMGKYVLMFDPLDGSSNIDINASIGTIFSIHRRRTESGPGTLEDCLQPGRDIIAAGYVIYGSSNMLVYSDGNGVHGFTLDPGVGTFFLSHESIRIPDSGRTYSVNEGNYHLWEPAVQRWVDALKKPDPSKNRPYGMRYIGAMVADFHRTLLCGGIFAYPSDNKNRNGKLRLLYEAAPLSFIAEAAGGSATDGQRRILDIQPQQLHQRTPLFIGSKNDVAEAQQIISAGSQTL